MNSESVLRIGHVGRTRSKALGLDFLQVDQLIDNVDHVVKYSRNREGAGRKAAFLNSLDQLQAYQIYAPKEDGVVLDFDASTDQAKAALAHLMTKEHLSRDWHYDANEQATIRRDVVEALCWMREFDPSLSRGLELVIGRVFFGRHRTLHGGTISDLIGAIWLSPKAGWTSATSKEHLVHEFIHNGIFLDDMVNAIFAMTVPEMTDHKVTSAMLRIPRGYDKSYHSAFVAWGVLNVRTALGIPCLNLASPLRTTLDGLLANQEPLLARGKAHLAQLNDLFSSYEFSNPAAAPAR